ncbi:MAG TPA: Spy/CpxP family protein refolding chaperone [Chitinophagaceae bacterium]|nr:Spy/CpxP family protein refolding chaperone [Chitinophagaceae bacterium]
MATIMTNRLFTWLLGILLLANAVTLVVFWIDRTRPENGPRAGAQGFLVQQLNFNDQQQQQFEALAKDHRAKAQEIRPKIKEAKDAMFELVKQPGVSDSIKQAAAAKVSGYIMQLDLYTLEHFQKIRAICNPEQQKKFDQILNQLTMMIGNQRPPGPGRDLQGRDLQGPPPDQQH